MVELAKTETVAGSATVEQVAEMLLVDVRAYEHDCMNVRKDRAGNVIGKPPVQGGGYAWRRTIGDLCFGRGGAKSVAPILLMEDGSVIDPAKTEAAIDVLLTAKTPGIVGKGDKVHVQDAGWHMRDTGNGHNSWLSTTVLSGFASQARKRQARGYVPDRAAFAAILASKPAAAVVVAEAKTRTRKAARKSRAE